MEIQNSPKQFEFGIQPLDQIMNDLGIKNHDLVAASALQITHKIVGKARKGRRLGRKVQLKIVDALNRVQGTTEFSLNDLFNYDGK
ncbi:MAG: hypothetical protein AB1650_01885 [Candidatus Omnitrophota bacterium]